jgi:mRNA interferase HicA
MENPNLPGKQLVVPNHGSKEIGKGLEQKIKKQAGLK